LVDISSKDALEVYSSTRAPKEKVERLVD